MPKPNFPDKSVFDRFYPYEIILKKSILDHFELFWVDLDQARFFMKNQTIFEKMLAWTSLESNENKEATYR